MAKQYKQYDKIFKENFEETITPLVRKILGLEVEKLEEISDQLTLEHEPGLLKDEPDLYKNGTRLPKWLNWLG